MKVKDLTGQRFGRLIAVSFSHVDEKPTKTKYKRFDRMWHCQCDCGQPRLASETNLVGGGVRSCGCWRSEIARSNGAKAIGYGNHRPPGEADFTSIFNRYKNSAKTSGRAFELSRDEFKQIVIQDCHYCGARPETSASKKSVNGKFKHNGIDRKDSARGYTLDNCVPCCFTCNHIKADRSPREFLDWVYRAYTGMKAKGLIND